MLFDDTSFRTLTLQMFQLDGSDVIPDELRPRFVFNNENRTSLARVLVEKVGATKAEALVVLLPAETALPVCDARAAPLRSHCR